MGVVYIQMRNALGKDHQTNKSQSTHHFHKCIHDIVISNVWLNFFRIACPAGKDDNRVAGIVVTVLTSTPVRKIISIYTAI